MKLKNYIKISTGQMNKDSRSLFYSFVKEIMPENLAVVKTTNNDGQPTKTKMFHKVVEGKNWYIIPLNQNPTEEQMDELFDRISGGLHMGNFELVSSLIESKDIFDNHMSSDDYDVVAEAFAKQMHEEWLNERINKGWRYGEERNDESMTHPLVKEWNSLTEDEKNIKPKMIKELIKLLQDNGFKITKK